MNVALIMGRKGSVGVKGKNVREVCGRPLCTYPMRAALKARRLDRVYVTTDCPQITALADEYGLNVIRRPPELASAEAEMSQGIVHAVDAIHGLEGEEPEILVTMHANCGIHRDGLIDECIEVLLSDESADSCVSARKVVDLHPFRQKQVTVLGYLDTWLDVPDEVANNRQLIRAESVILDGACRALWVKRCLPPTGQAPFRYLGHTIAWVENPSGLDVHSEDDLTLIEAYWRKHRDAMEVAMT